jgi:hypothetical protein
VSDLYVPKAQYEAKVAELRAWIVFRQNDGDVTRAYYAEMNALGPEGQLAVALFRAQKRSTAAKRYRGGFRRDAYDVKNWSLSEVCRLAAALPFTWGWKQDPKILFGGRGELGEPSWVLYVDLPTGQVSFHSKDRFKGPDYLGQFDGAEGASEARICAFCDSVSFPVLKGNS